MICLLSLPGLFSSAELKKGRTKPVFSKPTLSFQFCRTEKKLDKTRLFHTQFHALSLYSQQYRMPHGILWDT